MRMKPIPLILALGLILPLPAFAAGVSTDAGTTVDVARDVKAGETSATSAKQGKGNKTSRSDQVSATRQDETGERDSQTNTMGLETSALAMMLPILKDIEEGGTLRGMSPAVMAQIRLSRPLTSRSIAQKNVQLQNVILPLEQCAQSKSPAQFGEIAAAVDSITNHAAGIALYTKLVSKAYTLIAAKYGNIGTKVDMHSVVPNAEKAVRAALIAASNQIGGASCGTEYHFQGSALAQSRSQYVQAKNQLQGQLNQQSTMALGSEMLGAMGGASSASFGSAGKLMGQADKWQVQSKQTAMLHMGLTVPVSCPVVTITHCELPVGRASLVPEQDQLMVAGAPQWGGDQGMIMGYKLSLSENRSLEAHVSESDSDTRTKSKTRESYVSRDTDVTKSKDVATSSSKRVSDSLSSKSNLDASINPFK